METSDLAEGLLGKTYKKQHTLHSEYIKFQHDGKFWHRWRYENWSINAYRIRSDGDLELDWGKGVVHRCIFSKSTSTFTEMGYTCDATWELDADEDYSQGGSSSSSAPPSDPL